MQQGGHPVCRQVEQSRVTLLGIVPPEVVLQPELLRCILHRLHGHVLGFSAYPLCMVSKSNVGGEVCRTAYLLCGIACPRNRLTRGQENPHGLAQDVAGQDQAAMQGPPNYCIMVRMFGVVFVRTSSGLEDIKRLPAPGRTTRTGC